MTAPVPLPDPTAPAAPAPSRALPDGVTPAFARSVRFWSRAYPRRWRTARGDELLGLLADLTAPGATRLDARSAVDLVRSGWATRLREHPPLGPWLRYRFFGTRSLAEYRAWVADDIAGVFFTLRQGLLAVVIIGVVDWSRTWSGQPSLVATWSFWALVAGALTVDEVLLHGRTRSNAMSTHLVPRPGERVTDGSWVRVRSPRRRVAAQAALPWAVGVTTALLAAGVVATALASTMLWFEWNEPEEGPGFGLFDGPVSRAPLLATLGALLAVGVLFARVVRRRLVHVDTAVRQPERVLVGLGWRRAVGIVLGTALLGAFPLAEAFGAAQLMVGLVVGLVAAALTPSAVVAWRVVRRSPGLHGLAFVDVARVALRGRPPLVDQPGSCLAPARPSEVGQVRPWPWSNEGPTTALG